MRGHSHFVQTHRMGNSFPNPVYVDVILLASGDVNLLPAEKISSCPQKSILDRVSLVICIDIYWKRRKGVLEISHGHTERKSLKHACRENLRLFLLTRVMELGTLVFQKDNIERIKWIWYHILPLLVAKYYPNNSRIRVVLAISNPDIITGMESKISASC